MMRPSSTDRCTWAAALSGFRSSTVGGWAPPSSPEPYRRTATGVAYREPVTTWTAAAASVPMTRAARTAEKTSWRKGSVKT